MFNFFLKSIKYNIGMLMLTIYSASFNHAFAQNANNSNSNLMQNKNYSEQTTSNYSIKHGQQLAFACLACHSSPTMPNLYDMPIAVLQQKMQNYAKDLKKDTIMHQLLKGYSDKDIELIAEYFSSSSKNGDK